MNANTNTDTNRNRSWIGWVVAGVFLLALVLPVLIKFGGAYYRWGFGTASAAPDTKVVVETQVANAPVAQAPVVNAPAAGNSITAPASQCSARAEQLGAPAEIVTAICNTAPTGDSVSGQLASGTYVNLGTVTFDNEDRVWVLQGFTVPAKSSYAFEYAGSPQSIFSAPFVTGAELGYGANGTRVPFKICFNTEGECTPPANLFPTK